jgi:hypothetical protein
MVSSDLFISLCLLYTYWQGKGRMMGDDAGQGQASEKYHAEIVVREDR